MYQPAFNKLPPLHALAAFEAVARLKSFARAAEELCVTHGAVSHRIKTLEKHFGVRLFVRSGGAVLLTTKGAYLLGAVIDALSTLQEAVTRLAPVRRIVTISAGPSSAHHWLVARLGDFYREHGDIDLEITVTKLPADKKRASIESGEADVAIRYGRHSDWTGLQCVKLMDVTLFPVCSPAYFEKLGRPATPQALSKGVLLRLPHERWKPWFEAAGLDRDEPASGPVFSDASLLLDAAARGQGIALGRDVLVDEDIASGRLMKLFDVSVASPRSYYAVRSPHAAARSEVDSFVEWLMASSNRTLDASETSGARARPEHA